MNTLCNLDIDSITLSKNPSNVYVTVKCMSNLYLSWTLLNAEEIVLKHYESVCVRVCAFATTECKIDWEFVVFVLSYKENLLPLDIIFHYEITNYLSTLPLAYFICCILKILQHQN